MENKKIQFALGERFNAPLPEFYVRRIIFWKDEEREFEEELETLELPDVWTSVRTERLWQTDSTRWPYWLTD